MKLLITGILFLISINAYSKAVMNQTVQHKINNATLNSDTIFIGKVLEKQVIDDGLIVGASKKPIGIIKAEVTKTYRGNINTNQLVFLCTWFDGIENGFNFPVGHKYTFFGITTGYNIQMPMVNGFNFSATGIDTEISKALKLKGKRTKDRTPIFEIVDSEDAVTRNACNEPNFWKK